MLQMFFFVQVVVFHHDAKKNARRLIILQKKTQILTKLDIEPSKSGKLSLYGGARSILQRPCGIG